MSLILTTEESIKLNKCQKLNSLKGAMSSDQLAKKDTPLRLKIDPKWMTCREETCYRHIKRKTKRENRQRPLLQLIGHHQNSIHLIHSILKATFLSAKLMIISRILDIGIPWDTWTWRTTINTCPVDPPWTTKEELAVTVPIETWTPVK